MNLERVLGAQERHSTRSEARNIQFAVAVRFCGAAGAPLDVPVP